MKPVISSCVDTPVGASNFFSPARAVRSSAVTCPASGCGMSRAVGLPGGTRIGSKSFPRAQRRDDENWFSQPRLDDRLLLPAPPACPRLRRHPGLGRRVGRPPPERGPTSFCAVTAHAIRAMRLLLRALHHDETHRRAQRRLANRLRGRPRRSSGASRTASRRPEGPTEPRGPERRPSRPRSCALAHASIATTQRGCDDSSARTRLRGACLRNATDPSACTPCSWKLRFAGSMPIMRTSVIDASSLVNDPMSLMAHIGCRGRGRRPPHRSP